MPPGQRTPTAGKAWHGDQPVGDGGDGYTKYGEGTTTPIVREPSKTRLPAAFVMPSARRSIPLGRGHNNKNRRLVAPRIRSTR